MKTVFALMVLEGCVVHVPAGDGDGSASGDAELYFDPSVIRPGASVVATVTDDWATLDFRNTVDVRSLGDFSIVEWTSHEDRLELVVEVSPDASGDQPLAIDLAETYYTSFLAQ
jgi:hypothetical protein